MTTGVVYVAYGNAARIEARASIASLRRHNRFPVSVVGSRPFDGTRTILFEDAGPGARWAKLNVDHLVDYDNVIYLDADTRIHEDLSPAIAMLDRFDLILAPSVQQGESLMNHISPEERTLTLEEIENPHPLQLQAGVLFFNRRRCRRLFELWREEWQRYRDQDQAAFLRALYRSPVRIWILGYGWNSLRGEIIEHLFGRARV